MAPRAPQSRELLTTGLRTRAAHTPVGSSARHSPAPALRGRRTTATKAAAPQRLRLQARKPKGTQTPSSRARARCLGGSIIHHACCTQYATGHSCCTIWPKRRPPGPGFPACPESVQRAARLLYSLPGRPPVPAAYLENTASLASAHISSCSCLLRQYAYPAVCRFAHAVRIPRCMHDSSCSPLLRHYAYSAVCIYLGRGEASMHGLRMMWYGACLPSLVQLTVAFRLELGEAPPQACLATASTASHSVRICPPHPPNSSAHTASLPDAVSA